MMKLQGPANASSVTVAGEEFPVVDGVVEVPEQFGAELASFGFMPYVEPAPVAKLAMAQDTKAKFTPPAPPADTAAA